MSYQQFGHVDPEERLDYSDEPAPGVADEYYAPRRLMPGVLLMLGVMAVFAGGLWFAYHAGERHAESAVATVAPASASGPGSAAANAQLPLIRADADPVKVKPDKAGGMNIPDRNDPIYSMQQSASPAEHILPPPEAPAPRPLAPPQVAAVPQTMAPGIQPGPTPLPAPGPPPVASARSAPVGPPVKIQLASLRTPDEARDEWARVKRENADVLGKFTAVAVRADLGDRGIWYRVEVGPVGDHAAALRLCKALKERNLGCQIVP
ncbi:MAG TPA: SPOR domain-containing protein [Stellaceae bacterium]|nr:SPOR domain-containing protein [Stellaceae bacterium]